MAYAQSRLRYEPGDCVDFIAPTTAERYGLATLVDADWRIVRAECSPDEARMLCAADLPTIDDIGVSLPRQRLWTLGATFLAERLMPDLSADVFASVRDVLAKRHPLLLRMSGRIKRSTVFDCSLTREQLFALATMRGEESRDIFDGRLSAP